MVSLQSKQPGNIRESEISLTIGEYNTREYDIFTSAPLENGMSYTFSLGHSERDGFVKNTTLGSYEDYREHTGGRFNLYFDASDNLEVNLGIAVDKFDDGAQGLVGIVNPITGIRKQ